MRPWWETHPRHLWTRADEEAAQRLGVIPVIPDIENTDARLLAQSAASGPKVSWSAQTSDAARRRREVARLLEDRGLRKPLRW